MRILGPSDTGKGILIEMDAGHISPTDNFNKAIIEESNKSMLDYSKPFEFYAVLQKYNTPNRNGRVYPERILKREAENYRKMIEKGVALSELNHPESSLIDLDRVSHAITDIWWDGHILMGKLKLLTSPGFHERGVVSTKGDQAANLLRQGVTLGISSRGVGSLKKVGEQNEVQDDFELICFDLVSSPSTPGAYLFTDVKDRNNFEENLEEEKMSRLSSTSTSSGKGMDRSIDLLNKLNHYLNR
jgi:Prohead core protein serine protease